MAGRVYRKEAKIAAMLRRSSFFILLLFLLPGGAALAQASPPAKAPLSDSERKALAAKNLRESEGFLAANAKRPGVFTTYKGLQYEVLKPGKGPTPHSTDKVTISFEWLRADGTKLPVMDSGAPITVRVDQLIEGFTAAVQLMPLHAKWRIWLPPALAFGEAGRGELLGPNSVLVIECEIFGIRPAESRAPAKPSE
jgi:FKBP-type peptidyl-prolyl cis-trans isomerase